MNGGSLALRAASFADAALLSEASTLAREARNLASLASFADALGGSLLHECEVFVDFLDQSVAEHIGGGETQMDSIVCTDDFIPS